LSAVLLVAGLMAADAQAQDFFSTFFGVFGRHRSEPPMTPLPYVNEGNTIGSENSAPPARIYSYGGNSQAYCVRSCDGRYFPISGTSHQSRAAACNGLCPASETKLVYGGTIEDAVTEAGKPYSELPNAFRYRDQWVAHCTCNGKDPAGLAAMKIENDPTLRKGDIVAGNDGGLKIASHGADRRGASLDLTPAPEKTRSHDRRAPVGAAQ